MLTTVALVLGCAAILDDLRRRRISNWITVPGMVAGLTLSVWQGGLPGFLVALGGLAAGFAVFLLLHLFAGLGGGDVMLMTAFGALMGPASVLWAALFSLIAGGVLAASVLAGSLVLSTFQKKPAEGAATIPYGPAIVCGAWLALLVRS